ncbi:nucleotidyltransferase domain-containing protein, partial [Segetibacter sp.]|uniref:nucleotidyltransferase domain-containing protein n=1 Tax=Segetibacter sp. TaxID=2231182 RepID=UPI00344782D3
MTRPDYVEGESDIDIMVELHGYLGYGFIELAEKLEYILQKKVDLVSRDGLKP